MHLITQKRNTLRIIAATALFFSTMSVNSIAQTVTYSETHVNGATATAQCQAWGVFQNQLNPGVYLKMTIKGTFDPTGLVCTDRTVVNAMAQAIKTASTYISPPANGHVWSVCNRYNGEVWVDPPSSCSGSNCPSPGYIFRPCITNLNWGGVNTATCGAPTQVMTIVFEAGYPCTDTPKTSIKKPLQVCPNKGFVIAPDSFYADADYKWEYSPNGNNWSNFTGVVDTTTGGISDTINAPRWYRLTITCRTNPNWKWVTIHKVNIALFYYCYCDNEVTSDAGADIGTIKVISTTSGDTVLDTEPLVTGINTPPYSNTNAKNLYTAYHDSLSWPCLYRDTTYRFIINQIQTGPNLSAGVAQGYIDINRDGLYNPSTERIFVKAIDGTSNPPHIIDVSYKMPGNAEIGLTGMRVIISTDTVKVQPCSTLTGEGEVEDYVVEICHRPCDGPTTPGIVTSTDTSMCAGYEYTLTDTSYEQARSGFMRSWQVSGDNISWFNIQNSTNKDTLERVFSGQPLYYRLRVVCPTTRDTTYSPETKVNVKPGYKCYCYSKAVGGVDVDTSDIGGITIANYSNSHGGPHLLNTKAVRPRTDYTDINPLEIFTDSTYDFYVYHTMPVKEHGDAKITIFMDFDNDHEYDIPSERVFTGFTTIGNHTLVEKVAIPINAITDVPTGLRIILNNDVGPNVPSDEACGPYQSGETEDYLVIFRKQWRTGVTDVNAPANFGMFPNPSSGKVNITFSTPAAEAGPINISVRTVTGQVVLTKTYDHAGKTFHTEMDMSTYAAGVYIVELEVNGRRLVRKLTLQ